MKRLKQQVTTDAGGKVSTTLKVNAKKLQLWSPENPKRYQVELTLDNCTIADEIGFRTIETRDTFLGNLAKYARSLDNTRLISMAMEVTGASNYVNRLNDNMNEYVDVVSFNQYIGWYRDVNDAPEMRWEEVGSSPFLDMQGKFSTIHFQLSILIINFASQNKNL